LEKSEKLKKQVEKTKIEILKTKRDEKMAVAKTNYKAIKAEVNERDKYLREKNQ